MVVRYGWIMVLKIFLCTYKIDKAWRTLFEAKRMACALTLKSPLFVQYVKDPEILVILV